MGLQKTALVSAFVAGFAGAMLLPCPAKTTPEGSEMTTEAAAADTGGGFRLPDNFFPIMSWEVAGKSEELFSDPAHGLASLAQCGFSVAGFVRPKHLPTCEKLGLMAIVGGDTTKQQWLAMTDEEIVAAIRKMVDETSASPAVLGYFLADEPGVQHFPALAKAVAAVKKLAPGKLAYVNLFPDYATLGAPDLSQLGTDSYADYLERYVADVKPQFVSYDNYRVQFSRDMTSAARAASYYRNLLEVRGVAHKHNLPFWNIVSSNQIRKFTTVPSPANLLFQAYTTLAAGGQSVTWYTYYAKGYQYAPIDKDGNRTATWSYLKMVNEQIRVVGPAMRRLKSTGVFFTSPTPVPGLPVLPGKLVSDIETSTPLMLGEFAGPRDAKYAVVVNLSLERSTKITLKTPAEYRNIRHMSPADGSMLPLEDNASLWLPAAQGALIRLELPSP